MTSTTALQLLRFFVACWIFGFTFGLFWKVIRTFLGDWLV